MKAYLENTTLVVKRTETDTPVVPKPIPRPAKCTRKEYNSWREDYYLYFDTVEEATEVLEKVIKINNFDKVAMYLDSI